MGSNSNVQDALSRQQAKQTNISAFDAQDKVTKWLWMRWWHGRRWPQCEIGSWCWWERDRPIWGGLGWRRCRPFESKEYVQGEKMGYCCDSMPRFLLRVSACTIFGSSKYKGRLLMISRTCTSSIYTSTYSQILGELHTSREVATLGLSFFVVGLGCGPMFLSPLSEFYGRRPIYMVSFAFFVIWLIPSAVAKNIQTMLIARFFDGLSGSAFLSVAGGTVGDMFSRNELQAPMMIYTASPFLGPTIGPLIGGFINQYTHWRWTYYVLLIWSGVMLVAIVVFVPETYHPVLLRKKAEKLRRDTGDDRYRSAFEKSSKKISTTIITSLYRPFQLLVLEPMCLNLCLLSAILLGVLYLFFGAFTLIFEHNHHFTLSQVGLCFLGICTGMILGVCTDPIWHKNYQRLVRNREAAGGEPGGSEPEFRLPPAIFGAVLVPIGLFWFGWTTYSSIHWIVPIIGSTVFGMGWVLFLLLSFLIKFSHTSQMTVITMPRADYWSCRHIW